VIAYIDAHRDRFGVEPICRALQFAPRTYWAARARPVSARRARDESTWTSGLCCGFRQQRSNRRSLIAPSIPHPRGDLTSEPEFAAPVTHIYDRTRHARVSPLIRTHRVQLRKPNEVRNFARVD
jgi:hypothetical protein